MIESNSPSPQPISPSVSPPPPFQLDDPAKWVVQEALSHLEQNRFKGDRLVEAYLQLGADFKVLRNELSISLLSGQVDANLLERATELEQKIGLSELSFMENELDIAIGELAKVDTPVANRLVGILQCGDEQEVDQLILATPEQRQKIQAIKTRHLFVQRVSAEIASSPNAPVNFGSY